MAGFLLLLGMALVVQALVLPVEFVLERVNAVALTYLGGGFLDEDHEGLLVADHCPATGLGDAEEIHVRDAGAVDVDALLVDLADSDPIAGGFADLDTEVVPVALDDVETGDTRDIILPYGLVVDLKLHGVASSEVVSGRVLRRPPNRPRCSRRVWASRVS
jgi:hypothetical protein